MNREQDLLCMSGSFDSIHDTLGVEFPARVQEAHRHPAKRGSVATPAKAGTKMRNLICRAPVMVSILALLFSTSSAKAACGSPEHGSGFPVVVPFASQSGDEDSTSSTGRHHDHDGSILGLWHVTYVLSDGTPNFQSFKFWHPAGTEWESASVSPLDGNVCVGVWKETKAGTIRLHHVAWSFANGILTGTLTIDEINTVAPDGRTYKGTFTATFYDLNGNVLQQQKGTQTAKRITVNTTGAP